MQIIPLLQKNLAQFLTLGILFTGVLLPVKAEAFFWIPQTDFGIGITGDLGFLKDSRFEAVTTPAWSVRAQANLISFGGYGGLGVSGFLMGQQSSRIGSVVYKGYSGVGALAHLLFRPFLSENWRTSVTLGLGGGFFEYDHSDQVFLLPMIEGSLGAELALGGSFWVQGALLTAWQNNLDLDFHWRQGILVGLKYEF